MKNQNGFTLIELLIVAVIINILASVATPAYFNYQLRAKSLDGLHISAAIRNKIADYYRYTGYSPLITELQDSRPQKK